MPFTLIRPDQAGKQRKNEELDRAYGSTPAEKVTLRAAPSEKAAPMVERSTGTKLKVLRQENGLAQVRDEYGNEGWVDDSSIVAR
ncbi:MAG: SH3 domain-containing protein [Archangium sp.]|nr:SH3 domain-containing protein [Archangium sp.]